MMKHYLKQGTRDFDKKRNHLYSDAEEMFFLATKG